MGNIQKGGGFHGSVVIVAVLRGGASVLVAILRGGASVHAAGIFSLAGFPFVRASGALPATGSNIGSQSSVDA